MSNLRPLFHRDFHLQEFLGQPDTAVFDIREILIATHLFLERGYSLYREGLCPFHAHQVLGHLGGDRLGEALP